MAHPEFTSTQNHYGELRPVAAQIVGTILTRLGLTSDSKALKGEISAEKFPGGKIPDGTESLASNPASYSSGTRLGDSLPAARSLGIFANPEDNGALLANSALATSTAVAAGMMGIPFLSLVAGNSQTQVGSRSDSRPSYFVEGTTTAQGESHGGTGGQSSQGQQDHHPQNPETIFLA
jgi:hypothetical protein